ncbi:MAG: hypothetical protein SNJ58_01380 [Aggregatilineales bacterium]
MLPLSRESCRTPDATPLDYATMQVGLGNACSDLAEVADREENL